MEQEVSSRNKKDCFAFLNEKKCNALSILDCSNCAFYKHFKDVPDYEKYLPSEYRIARKEKMKIENESNKCISKNR